MTESLPRPKIRVRQDGEAAPYIIVGREELPYVRETLDKNGIYYWVDSDWLSWNGNPMTTVVNFKRAVELSNVQTLFDVA